MTDHDEDASFDTAELEDAEPAKAILDPFDPARLRLSQDFAESVGVQKLLISVPVKKPDRQWFIRVRGGEEWRLTAGIIELKEERENYLVVPQLVSQLPGEVSARMIVTAMTRQGTLFLWPIKLPDGKRENAWTATALTCATLAERQWIRVVSNMSAGCYEPYCATSDSIPDPEWPDKSFRELLELGFKGRLITSLDHEVIRQLLGAA